MFWDLFIFREHSTWEPAYRRVTYFILRAYTQEPQLTQEKIGRGFRKNAGEWTGRVEISRKKSLAVRVACMTIHLPTPGFNGRTLELCVLNRWDFNFYARCSPLQGFKVEISSCEPISHSWAKDQSTLAKRAKAIVDERPLASCV